MEISGPSPPETRRQNNLPTTGKKASLTRRFYPLYYDSGTIILRVFGNNKILYAKVSLEG